MAGQVYVATMHIATVCESPEEAKRQIDAMAAALLEDHGAAITNADEPMALSDDHPYAAHVREAAR